MYSHPLRKMFLNVIGILYLILTLETNISAFPPQFPNPNIQKQQTHEGDLILTGSQTMTIQNTDYKVNGSIVLQDSSQLIIRHSIIDMLTQPGDGRAVRLQGSSILRADTTIFGGVDVTVGMDPSEAEMHKMGDIITDHDSQLILNNCFSLLQTFMGNSKVTIRNSYLVLEPLGLIHVEGTADVLIEDSLVGALFIDVPDEIPVVIDSLRPGYFDYWSARESISDSLTYNLVLRRTEVMENKKGYKGGMEIGWTIAVDALKSIVTISDSKLNRLVIGFPDGEPAFVSDLVTRQPMNFNLNNIHLINTEIQTQWGVFMNGGPAEIINSEGLFIFMTGGDSDVLVHNSEVSEIDPRNYSGTLIFENSTWLGGYEIFENSDINIRGSVRMLPTVPIFDETSTMTRYYDVYLLNDLDGSPFPDVNLTLSKDSTPVWNGATDHEGKVSFDITFDSNNFEDEWLLSTDTDQIHMNKPFSIYISNPVMISLELEEDGIHYRPVIHVAPENPNFPFGTRESPYPAIQEAILNAGNDIIHVEPGKYPGYIAPGKTRGSVTLKDGVVIIGSGADQTILEGNVIAEDVNGAQISGFTIEDGIQARSSSITITNNVLTHHSGEAIWSTESNLNIMNNVISYNAANGIFLHDSCTAVIRNNIITNNQMMGINGLESSSATINYNDVWGNTENYMEFFSPGAHDISLDPLFADPNNNDFHLKSSAGRWDPNSQSWVQDDVTSPCIDAGDPNSDWSEELWPHGERINMGAYGGTSEASMSLSNAGKAVYIQWLGHASVKIWATDVVIYIDPRKLSESPHDATLVLVTHTHGDHYQPTDIAMVSGSETIFIAPADVVARQGTGQVILPGQTIQLDEVSVTAVPAYNTNKPNHPKSNNWVGYIIEIASKRIYVAGDTDLIEEMKTLGHIDVAILPAGGTYTMNAQEAAEATKYIKPLLAIPYHWGDIVGSLSDAEKFAEMADCNVKIMSVGEILSSEDWQKDFSLIAHWKLDETEGSIAQDSAGGNDGTTYGEPLWLPAGGKVDGALQFDGIDDYVSTPFILNPAIGKFSVFAWIKGGAPGQVAISQTGGVGWLLADPAEGKLITSLMPSAIGRFLPQPLVSEFVITDGDWHRIGFVWDGSNRILYVDDIEVVKDTQSQLAGSTGGLNIGAGKNLDAGSLFSGLIDDVRIYKRAVTP